MQIKAIKPFLGSVEGLIDNGQVFDADENRAKELIEIGLVEPFNPAEANKVVKPVKEKKSK
jgi:hypothetical protein